MEASVDVKASDNKDADDDDFVNVVEEFEDIRYDDTGESDENGKDDADEFVDVENHVWFACACASLPTPPKVRLDGNEDDDIV